MRDSTQRTARAGPEAAERLRLARSLMDEFARATGLEGAAPPRRYLRTDAFAVANFLGLHRATGEGRYLDLALVLVDQVHYALGRHRLGDPRTGWISGRSEAVSERHPPLEWDLHGQYFHDLTEWMHALRRVAEETAQPVFLRWAIELARTAHAAFVARDKGGSPERMVRRRNVDLTSTLVPSMGQHDPLDAWLTDLELTTAAAEAEAPAELALETAEAAALCNAGQWETDDPLRVGALLVALYRLERLRRLATAVDDELATRLVAAARTSLGLFVRGSLQLPAEARLAFRELGLALGLHAVARLDSLPTSGDELLDDVVRHHPDALCIDRFWSDPGNRRAPSWLDHAEVNSVMLATSLAPDGYLGAA